MKKKMMALLIATLMIANSITAFSATVIDKKDAAQYSNKNPYSQINVGISEDDASQSSGTNQYTAGSIKDAVQEDKENRFTATTAVKQGNKYTNAWSNYTVTLEDNFKAAADFYDFNAEGIKYDFAVQFNDYSRLAVYYSTLSRDINEIAKIYSGHNNIVTDEVVAGEVFKHAHKDVRYPYGVEKYDYYLRNIDGKLMVIECYYEQENEDAPHYLKQFVKVN